MSRKIGYARVSSREQNLARQIEALKEYVPENMIVIDRASGKDFDRPGYQSLRNGNKKLKRGDTLYIKSLDRFSRNKELAKKELQYFQNIGVRIRIIDIPSTLIDAPEGQEWIMDMVNNILIEVITSIAENERQTIKQRQAEGLAVMPIDTATGKRKSLKTGNVIGRPPATYPESWESVYTAWKAGNISVKRAMELLEMKRTTFYKLAKLYREANIKSKPPLQATGHPICDAAEQRDI